MSAPEFDLGPLTWVKGEIDQALERAGEALAAYAANPADAKQLKFCKTHLHQTHGALEIVGLDGVTRLTEECERLVDAIDDGSLQLNAARRTALAGAFTALGAYLDELVDGMPHQPVRLFPAYQAVMEARGAERVSEADLFFPDLSPRPPRRANTEVPADMRAYITGQRRRFQAGLLRWLRNAADNAALREMAEAVRAIERTQAMPQHRAFWWVTIGFAEALVAVGASASLDAKRLCARIDLQMKRLMEGSQNVAERLMRDTLYFVAKSRVQTSQVQAVRRVYALDRAIPQPDESRRDVRPYEADLRALREIVDRAKDKWNRFTTGHAHELAAFQEQAAQMRERAARLTNPDLSMLVSAIAAVGAQVGDSGAGLTESIALECATALLLTENAVEQYARPAEEFPRQVAAMVSRLKSALAGQPTEVAPPMLDEIARRAQERRVMAQVVGEIRGNLGSIETTLDAFFRDADKRGELAGLDVQLRQVAGALSMIGGDRAVQAVGDCRADVARFAQADYEPAQADFERVAQVMSALGFYVDALQHGPADFDEAMRPVSPRRPVEAPLEEEEITAELEAVMPQAVEAAGGDARTVEDELVGQRKDAAALFEAWRDRPGDDMLAAELTANLTTIRESADLVDDGELKLSATRALELLRVPAADATLADMESAMAGVAPQAAETGPIEPSAEVTALAASSAEVVDAELLAIFLEEAGEVLGTIGARLAAVRAQPADKDAVTVIRRGFHTLKGSGRMVGLNRFGEAAWAVEQSMNQWLQDFRPADADQLAMLDAAHALFERWVDDLASRGESTADGAPLIAACERMREGGAFELVSPVSSAIVASAPVATAPEAGPAAAAITRGPDGAPDRSIIIGDMRVSPGLYGIFVDESGTHVATLKAEIDLMTAEPQTPREEILRAAHTLAGIAGTVNFRRLHELARALERALLVAKTAGIVPEPDDMDLLHEVVTAIGELVEAVRALREPPAIAQYEARLEACRAAWLASSGEIDPVLLQIAQPPGEHDDVPDVPAPAAQPSFEPAANAESTAGPALDEPASVAQSALESVPADGTDALADGAPAAQDVPVDASAPTIRIRTIQGVPIEEAGSGALDFDFSDMQDDDSAALPPVAVDLALDADEIVPPEVGLDEAGAGEAATGIDIDFDAMGPAVGDTLTGALDVVDLEAPGADFADAAADSGAAARPTPFDVTPGEAGDAGATPVAIDVMPDAPVDAGETATFAAPQAEPVEGETAAEGHATAMVDAPAAFPPVEAGEALEPPEAAEAAQAAAFTEPVDVPVVLESFDAPESAALEDPVPALDKPDRMDADGTAPASGFAFDTGEGFALAEPAPEPAPAAVPLEVPVDAAHDAARTAQPAGAATTAAMFGAALAAGAVAADLAALDAEELMTLSDAELRERGIDPATRALPRIEDEVDEQLLPIFLEEAAELMPRLESQLRAWSGEPGDLTRAQALQRTLHTLKGSARMAGAMALGQVAHSMETRVENALALTHIPPTIFDGLTNSCDRVNTLLDGLRGEPAGTPMSATAPAPVSSGVAQAPPPAAPASAHDPIAASVPPAATPGAAPAPAPATHDEAQQALLRVRADLVDRLVNEAGEVAIARSRIEGELRAVKTSLRDLTESVNRLRNQLREIEIAAESQMQSRQREAEERHESFDPLEFDRFTRFQELTRMMAESVNDVATVQQNLLKNVDDADLALLSQARMNRDLQGDLMRVRMVPFNTVADRLYRVVRQAAKESGKRANLDIRGLQTEIDRSVLDRMTGPFEHLLRNAIAHGIEAPVERAARGKAGIGQIVLTARQEGNEFFLQFEDDGAGLDYARIRSRAIQAGLASEGDELSDAQITEFIFAPGFSTADSVSTLAGRGVGMDVVRSEVAALGGRIDTESRAGGGTRFAIALPLTLAVTQVVLVRADAHLYAIPSVMVEQVRQTRAEELAASYETQQVRWQEREYPLFYLPRLLGDATTRAQDQRSTPVLLVRSGTQRAAIHVDEMVGNQEVVVKNIGPQLARVTGIAGATVLGDGRIVLILNPVPLALQALSAGRHGGPEADAAVVAERSRLALPSAPTVMVVDDSLTVRKITSRLLARENYQVVTARDGVDALEQLQETRPDLMLVDIEMPRMDGFDLTRNVRADARLRGVPIIMITSRTAEKHRAYALEIGVNVFLGKPFQEDELLGHIASLLHPVAAAS